MRRAHKFQPEELYNLFIFLLLQPPVSSAVLSWWQSLVNHRSDKLLWSAQRAEGSRTLTTRGSRGVIQWALTLSEVKMMSHWQAANSLLWLLMLPTLSGCWKAGLLWHLPGEFCLKPHPCPPEPASGSSLPLYSAASLHGPAYGHEKYSQWLEGSWSVEQIWPRGAKESFVGAAVYERSCFYGLELQDRPLEHENRAWRSLLFACRAGITKQQAEHRSTWCCRNRKVWRGVCQPGKFCVSHVCWSNCLIILQDAACFSPEQHTWVHMPRQASTSFSGAVSFGLHERWVNSNLLRSSVEFLAAVWLPLNYTPSTSPLRSLSAPRNGQCWTQEVVSKDTTADFLQRDAEFLQELSFDPLL